VFTPLENEVGWARRTLQALKEASEQGKGAVQVDGKMIDAASARMAENVVRKDDAIKEKEK
jgi:malyl-CoA/(S)-citramalyl-CoA lyase